jgi:general secretion pathway protein J
MKRIGGFTLVELLAALVVMSLMALLCWRVVDTMARNHAHVQQRFGHVQRLQLALAQWQSDLGALVETGTLPPLAFDGRALTLVRQAAPTDAPGAGVRLVLWTRALPATDAGAARWVRWQSGPLTNIFEIYLASDRAYEWLALGADPARTDPADTALAMLAAVDWRLLYYRGNSWVNPLSADGKSPELSLSFQATQLPDAIRLDLTLAAEHGLAGTLTQMWMNPLMSKALP